LAFISGLMLLRERTCHLIHTRGLAAMKMRIEDGMEFFVISII